jgi:L-ascorbate metabolism protein UlaG (beta-lactamase superfamily)
MSCVKLQSDDVQVLINPFQDNGISMPKLKVDVVLSTNMEDDMANNIDRLQGDPFVISNPGEFEVQGVFVYGVPHGTGAHFLVEAEGITVAHLGTSAAELTNDQLSRLEGADILFIPVTGGDAKKYNSIISSIEPRVIIPIQYSTPKVKAKLDPIDAFAKEFGIKDTSGEKKVILKKKDLPVDEQRTIVLSPA